MQSCREIGTVGWSCITTKLPPPPLLEVAPFSTASAITESLLPLRIDCGPPFLLGSWLLLGSCSCFCSWLSTSSSLPFPFHSSNFYHAYLFTTMITTTPSSCNFSSYITPASSTGCSTSEAPSV